MLAVFLVRPTGFEPAAYRVGVCHSIQLSYGRIWSRGRLSPLRLIYYTIFFGNVKKKTAQKTKKIVKKVDKFWNLEYNSERRKQAVGESGLQPGSCRRQRRRTHMKKQKVSDAVIHRLPRYYRYLDELHNKGVVRISSNSLGQKMDITASQIRQDLSCFGEFGQQGYGYNVAELRSEIGHILGIDSGYRLIVVGAGHLGHALLQNFDFQKVGFQVDTAFDVSPALIGTKIHDVTIWPMEELEHYVEEYHPNVAVLTVPQSVAQSLADRLIALGVKGFWNFTNVELSTQTKGVFFEDIHFVDTLLTLSYRISRPEELY